ncbi:MAG: hypothetical protein F4090_02465 [Nitrospira sp. SB0672_bin_25]|nr:hypothetical protein [Nitrospira sp. SB0666_bin_27]MYJ53769.1 hypothetical protein [Nitrospira sp. SB0672_bin_25]
MSKCIFCHERKGKRPCPALGGAICSQCCGTHRVVSIACHSDCVYLDTNVEYQQKRVGDQFEQERRAFYKDLLEQSGDKAAEMFYFLEAVTFKHFQAKSDAQDGEVIAAIQALRRSFSPIHVPEGMAPPFTQALKKEYDAFMEGEKPDAQMVSEVLDRGLTFISEFSGTGLRSNRFLSGLIGFLKSRHPDVAEKLTKLGTTGGRIILPGSAPVEDQPRTLG